MRLTVFGAGYVGLSSALAFAHFGHRVVCVEPEPTRLEMLRARHDPLGEPGFEDLLRSSSAVFQSNDPALAEADVVLVAVGTPMRPDGHPDLSQLDACVATIASQAAAGVTVLIRSTVPVGTCDRLQAGPLHRQDVVSNPEFLREGHALEDTFTPHRVVAGGPGRAEAVVRQLYAPILDGTGAPAGQLHRAAPVPLVWMDARSAELAKYAANGFLATKLSFVNEITNLANMIGASPQAVLQALSLDPRIGPHHLRPGLGWGGSCFPKDTRALDAFAAHNGYDLLVLRAAIEQNNRQLVGFANAIAAEVGAQAKIGLLGLAFKAGTADTRESPALALAHRLVETGATVTAYDPMVTELSPGLDAVHLREDAYAACTDVDAAVIATEWPEFAALDLVVLRNTMRGNLLFDGRTIIDPQAATAAGLRYRGVGMPPRAEEPPYIRLAV